MAQNDWRFRFRSDTSFVPSATLDVALIATGGANLPLGAMGTLLCDPSNLVVVLSLPGQPFAVPIPENQMLGGVDLCVQGASVDAAAMPLLANALDITIGCF
ncbi:MAG: hypothetical protein AAF628_04040 [Planctomycetota bacterium]